MRKIVFICLLFFLQSCKNEQSQKTETAKENAEPAVKSKTEPVVSKQEELAIVDTGQTWFRVRITKNDSAFMDYEGSWPVFFLSGNSATLQLSKSRNIMSITDILTIYMNGMPSGKAPVLASNRDKGTVSMIMSPVTDGAYGLPIIPTEGSFTLTKNVDSIVSGNFEGMAIEPDKNRYLFKGYFINARINPTKI